MPLWLRLRLKLGSSQSGAPAVCEVRQCISEWFCARPPLSRQPRPHTPAQVRANTILHRGHPRPIGRTPSYRFGQGRWLQWLMSVLVKQKQNTGWAPEHVVTPYLRRLFTGWQNAASLLQHLGILNLNSTSTEIDKEPHPCYQLPNESSTSTNSRSGGEMPFSLATKSPWALSLPGASTRLSPAHSRATLLPLSYEVPCTRPAGSRKGTGRPTTRRAIAK